MSAPSLPLLACLALAVAACPPMGRAEEGEGHAEPADLGILDFFGSGWGEEWVHRHRATPDMALFRVATNFLERELRLDYAYADLRGNAHFRATQLANALIAYGVNRRLMLEVVANYQWNVAPGQPPVHGSGAAALARFQLVDTPTASYSVQLRASAPNRGLGQTQTTLAYYLAGWQDVAAWAPWLGRVGLYYSLEYDSLVGAHAPGAAESTLSYDVSLARTWTGERTPVVSNLTTFLELYGTTPLDGAGTGKTLLTLTPGVRFWFVPGSSLSAGVDLPVSHGPPISTVWRATYILNF